MSNSQGQHEGSLPRPSPPSLSTHPPANHDTDANNNVSPLDEVLTEKTLPPTDVGWTPWLQVLAAFFLMVNCWGLLVSFGTFQTYYTTGGIADESAPSTIAWIGSVQAFLLMCGGAFGGAMFDSGYFRPMMYLGSAMVVFGLMMTSLSTRYYQVMLAQALCTGGGMALFVVTALGTASTWFTRWRGVATGIVSTGASLGGLVYPVLLHELAPRVGFPWSVRAAGFIALATLALPIAVLRQRLPPRRRAHVVEYPALRQPEFSLYVAAIFATFLGFFMMYTFVERWAIDAGIDMGGLPVFYLLPIVNAASAVGRILPALVADFVGPLNVQVPATAVSGVLLLAWVPVQGLGPVVAIAVLYGFFTGALIALPPVAVASMTEDLTTFGGRFGVVFIAMGFGSLIGNPVQGAIIQHEKGGYDGARVFAGIMLLAGSAFMAATRMVKTGWRLQVRA